MKKYEFKDTFIKTCEFIDGSGECKKTRKSEKCIDNVCENINLSSSKKDILKDYYSQSGSGKYLQPRQCDYCDYKTSDLSSLVKHKRIHTGEKPYICNHNGCDYKTSDSSSFSRHKKKHDANLLLHYKTSDLSDFKICNHNGCDYKTSDLSNLRRHKKTHDANLLLHFQKQIGGFNEKQFYFSCPTCNYPTRSFRKFTKHVYKHSKTG